MYQSGPCRVNWYLAGWRGPRRNGSRLMACSLFKKGNRTAVWMRKGWRQKGLKRDEGRTPKESLGDHTVWCRTAVPTVRIAWYENRCAGG